MKVNNIKIKVAVNFTTDMLSCILEQSLYCWSEWLEDGYRFFLLAEDHDAPKYVLVCIAYTFFYTNLFT